MSTERTKFDQWAIVELMGHNTIAGRVTEEVVAGKALLRIDVPRGDSFTTKLYNPDSLYGITPVAEDIARTVATRLGDRLSVLPFEARRAVAEIEYVPKTTHHDDIEQCYDDDTAQGAAARDRY